MKNRITEDRITELKENEIFVFGSNEAGIHGAGAAYTAKEIFGAVQGIGVGLQGKTYAIPTKNKDIKTLNILEIRKYILEFIEHAKNNPDNIYLVTEIGCGLAGYKPYQIAPFFQGAIELENIHLPKNFWDELR